jgi:hypothetical protein
LLALHLGAECKQLFSVLQVTYVLWEARQIRVSARIGEKDKARQPQSPCFSIFLMRDREFLAIRDEPIAPRQEEDVEVALPQFRQGYASRIEMGL